MTSDAKLVQPSLEAIADQLDKFIAALPEFSELDGVVYRKSPLSGVYYLAQPQRIPFFTREEWVEHAKTCPNPKCPGKTKYA